MTEFKDAADECAYLMSLAQVQIVHVGAGLAEWRDLSATLRRAADAAMRAARDEVE